MIVRWLTVFIDRPAAAFEATSRFWSEITGSTLSSPRGWDRQFATLIPPDGDAYVRVQRVEQGPGGSHLDVHVDNVAKGVKAATALGAAQRHAEDNLVVMTSPGGLAFCVVNHDGQGTRPRPIASPGARDRTLVDQVCIDAPAAAFEAEVEFWSELFHRPGHAGSRDEFVTLERAEGMPIRLLLQRLDGTEPGRAVTAHLDIACSDVDAANDRHVDLGATFVERYDEWTTLADPSGIQYCLTSRDPDTGLLTH